MPRSAFFLSNYRTAQIVILTVALTITAFAQTKRPEKIDELKSGQSETREMAGKAEHRYKFALTQNEFFQVKVEQKGIDVSLRLTDAAGNSLAATDTPNAKEGFKALSFVALKDGDYLLTVVGPNEKTEKGAYVITRAASRPATPTERLSAADSMLEKAEKLEETAFKIIDEAQKADKKTKEARLSKAKNLLLDAVAIYKDAIVLTKDSEKDAYRIFYLFKIGRNYHRVGDTQNSVNYLRQAFDLNSSDKFKNIRFHHWILAEIASAYDDSENEFEAIQSYKQALIDYGDNWNVDKDEDFLPSMVDRFMYLLVASSDYGTYQEINQIQERLLKLAKKLKSRVLEQLLLIEIGKTHYDMGQYDKAIEKYNETKKIDENNDFIEEKLARGTATIYLRTGRLEEAEKLYEKSKKLAATRGDKESVIIDELNLGCVYARTNNLSKNQSAIKIFRTYFPEMEKWQSSSTSKIEKLQYARYTLETAFYYALAYRKINNPNSAIRILEKSLNNAKGFNLTKYESRAQIEIGLNYLSLNRLELAAKQFRSAYLLSKQAKVRDEEFASLDGLMNYWALSGNHALAIFYGKQAVNLLQQTRGALQKLEVSFVQDFLKDNSVTYRKLVDLLVADGRFSEAEQVLRMLKADEYSKFVRRDPEEIKKLSQRLEPLAKEKSILEKYELYAAKLVAIGVEIESLEKEKERKGENFEKQNLLDEKQKILEDAQKAFDKFLTVELVAEFKKDGKTFAPRDIRNEIAIQNELQTANAVSLYTVVGEERYRVILTTSKIQVDGKSEIKNTELNSKIFAFRDALQNPSIDPRPLGKELYDILVKPIEKQIADSKATTLLWSLDGTLRYIPLAALWDGKQYLMEKYKIVSITPQTRISEGANRENWRIFGGGVTKQSLVSLESENLVFKELPGVADELTTIVKDAPTRGIIAGKKLLDEDFTFKSLADELNGESYSVLHFATHFRLGRDKNTSFLLLGNNEILTLDDFLYSKKIKIGNVDLIVLSACETAFGNSAADENGAEVDSLATFAERRGAKSVMASLWSVADKSTGELMIEFYRRLQEEPKIDKAEALRKAQLALMTGQYKAGETPAWRGIEAVGSKPNNQPPFKTDDKAPFAHPFYWSPFVLIGNWR